MLMIYPLLVPRGMKMEKKRMRRLYTSPLSSTSGLRICSETCRYHTICSGTREKEKNRKEERAETEEKLYHGGERGVPADT
jgi:hypothetical protein